jgi:hypothetical protein
MTTTCLGMRVHDDHPPGIGWLFGDSLPLHRFESSLDLIGQVRDGKWHNGVELDLPRDQIRGVGPLKIGGQRDAVPPIGEALGISDYGRRKAQASRTPTNRQHADVEEGRWRSVSAQGKEDGQDMPPSV